MSVGDAASITWHQLGMHQRDIGGTKHQLGTAEDLIGGHDRGSGHGRFFTGTMLLVDLSNFLQFCHQCSHFHHKHRCAPHGTQWCCTADQGDA